MTLTKSSQNTRERILIQLRKNKTVTVSGLSNAWGLTRANIRYHLNLLIQEGLVEKAPRTPGQLINRGRPVLLYRLATPWKPNNLAMLCKALLHRYLDVQSTDLQSSALRALAKEMAGEQSSSTSLIQRLNRSISYLDNHAYQATWEATPTGPRVLLRNCPYAFIIDQHPELCNFDTFLIEHLIQHPFTQVIKMNRETGNPPACIFCFVPA